MQVPDGWQVVRLGDILVLNQPGAWGDEPSPDDPGVRVLRATDLTRDGRVNPEAAAWRRLSDRDRERRLMRDGDLILERSGGGPGTPVGRVAIIDGFGPVYCNNFCQHLRVDASRCSPFYVARALWHRYVQGVTTRLQHQTTGIRNLDYAGYLAFPLLLPPLPEQRAIAAVLDSIDEAIEGVEAVITATERLRDTLLHELLTRGVPGWHTQWKDVPGIGTIPAAWEVVRLGEIYEVQLGKMLSPKARQGKNPRPYLTNRSVRWGKFDLSDLPTMDFDRREIEKFQLRPGDLLVCEGGDTGRAAVWLGEIADCYYQKALHRLRPIDENAISEFMLAVLMSYATKGILLEHSERTSISHLTRERLLRMRIPHSSRAEQDEIVAALGCVADSIRWAREEQDRIQTLKSSAAAALLMGRVRVDRLGR